VFKGLSVHIILKDKKRTENKLV